MEFSQEFTDSLKQTAEKSEIVYAKRNRGSKKPGGNRHGNNNQGQKGQNGGFFSEGKHNAEQKNGEFSFDTIHGLKLKPVTYSVPSSAERKQKRQEFDGVRDENGNLIKGGKRAEFLKMLANEHEKTLVERLGLTETDIDGMKEGFTPNGFNVHHKLALHGGGKNENSNFILTPLYPHDQWHKDVMDAQILGLQPGQSRDILIPWTDEMIYNPKDFGFTRDNEAVKPNYTSNVNPKNYPDLYKPEHISVSKRQKDMQEFYDHIAEVKPEKAKANPVVAKKMASMGR